MRNSLLNRAAMTGVIALSISNFTMAEKAPDKVVSPAAPKVEAAPAEDKAPVTELATKADSSYAVGYSIGDMFAREFGRHGVQIDDFDMEVFVKALTTAAKGDKPELANDKLQAGMMALSEFVQSREKALAEVNLKAGTEFLEKNGKREGVKTNESGLQYEVLVKGGEVKYVAPKEGEPEKQFIVNYKGTRIDGTQFDASPEGTPVPMTLPIFEGISEALTTMPVGAKWKLFIPAKLAYGERRANTDMGPNTTLIFELELVEIKDAPPAAPGGFQIPGQ